MIDKSCSKSLRSHSPYSFFIREKRQELFERHPDVMHNDILKVISQLWKNTSTEEREKYNKLAEEDRIRSKAEEQKNLDDENHSTKNDPKPPQSIVKEFFGSKEEEKVFNTVIESEEFKNADTFRSQISILAQNFLKATGIIPFARIANSFNKSRQSIRNQYLKSLKPKKNEW